MGLELELSMEHGAECGGGSWERELSRELEMGDGVVAYRTPALQHSMARRIGDATQLDGEHRP